MLGVRSRGFAAVATAMSSGRKRSTQSAPSAGVVNPYSCAWSAASTPLPPPNVTIPTPLPCGILPGKTSASISATSTSASTDVTRMTPHSCSTASNTRSSPTSAPVWALAARAADGLAPDLIMTTGLPRRRASSQRGHQRRTIADPFEVSGDDPRSRVVRKSADIIGERDHRFVAAADQHADAEAGFQHVGHRSRADAAALGDQRNAARRELLYLDQRGGEGRRHRHGGVDEAHAIRPAQREAGLATQRGQLALRADARFLPRLRQATRVRDAVTNADGNAFTNGRTQRFARNGEHDEIGNPRQVGDRCVTRQTADALGRTIDRPDRTREAKPHQAIDRVAAQIARTVGRAYDGNGGRRQHCRDIGEWRRHGFGPAAYDALSCGRPTSTLALPSVTFTPFSSSHQTSSA